MALQVLRLSGRERRRLVAGILGEIRCIGNAMNAEQPLLTVTQVAELTRFSRSMIRRSIQMGKLVASRNGDGKLRPYGISRQALVEFLEDRVTCAAIKEDLARRGIKGPHIIISARTLPSLSSLIKL
jgi:excisionase family DNA binding protein